MQHLLLLDDDSGSHAVELHAESSSIGRDASNSIVLHAKDVSRQHAILLRVTSPESNDHSFRIIDGDLRGRPSTNGLFVNGRRCRSHNLCHGDALIFGAQVKARYHIAKSAEEAEWLLGGGETAEDFLATMIAEPVTQSVDGETDSSYDADLIRLASFPELFLHPIVELSLTGEITYLNPAAVNQFPDLQTCQMAHPVLENVIELVQQHSGPHCVREVQVGEQIFEQSLNYIPQSDLIRSYLVDITDRKRAQAELQALHDALEVQVQERTSQYLEAAERLKQEEQALLSSYATNRALLNAIPDPMLRLSHLGHIVNFKTPRQHTLPFEPEACLHAHLSDVFPAEVAVALQNCIDVALQTEEMQILEFQLPAETGVLEFEARLAVSASHEVMAIIRDITERKQAESDIRTALERERELNEMKTRFVSMTSHEFRTPLTTILSSAELLEYYSDQWAFPKRFKYLRKIAVAALHMTDLLNDVLLINKAAAGKIDFSPQPLVLNTFCQDLIEELQITTDSHQLILRSHLPDRPYQLDRKLLRHILSNLLSNAINYSPQGGDIIVHLDQTTDTLVLSVQDHGIGIPESSRPTIFDSFVRGNNVGVISGTGLGLAILKKSVECHQGQIDFQSTVGEGTTFMISLPLVVTPVLSETTSNYDVNEAVSANAVKAL